MSRASIGLRLAAWLARPSGTSGGSPLPAEPRDPQKGIAAAPGAGQASATAPVPLKPRRRRLSPDSSDSAEPAGLASAQAGGQLVGLSSATGGSFLAGVSEVPAPAPTMTQLSLLGSSPRGTCGEAGAGTGAASEEPEEAAAPEPLLEAPAGLMVEALAAAAPPPWGSCSFSAKASNWTLKASRSFLSCPEFEPAAEGAERSKRSRSWCSSLQDVGAGDNRQEEGWWGRAGGQGGTEGRQDRPVLGQRGQVRSGQGLVRQGTFGRPPTHVLSTGTLMYCKLKAPGYRCLICCTYCTCKAALVVLPVAWVRNPCHPISRCSLTPYC